MPVSELAILLAIAGFALIAAELCLPAHGLLGMCAAVALLLALGLSFSVSPLVGLITLGSSLAAAPGVAWFIVNLWPRSPVGRRLILGPPIEFASPTALQPGEIGRTVTELRPMGICDFDGRRLEARSEHGIIPAGEEVRVIESASKHLVVRATASTAV